MQPAENLGQSGHSGIPTISSRAEVRFGAIRSAWPSEVVYSTGRRLALPHREERAVCPFTSDSLKIVARRQTHGLHRLSARQTELEHGQQVDGDLAVPEACEHRVITNHAPHHSNSKLGRPVMARQLPKLSTQQQPWTRERTLAWSDGARKGQSMIRSGAFPLGAGASSALPCLAGQHGPAEDRGPYAGQRTSTGLTH